MKHRSQDLVDVMMGIPAPENVERLTIERVKVEQLGLIYKMKVSLFEMHKHVSKSVQKSASQLRDHSKKTNVVAPSFNVGDFVPVRRAQNLEHKLKFRWFGSQRTTTVVSDLVYDVKKLNGTDFERVDCARLKLYCTSVEKAAVLLQLLELTEQTEYKYEVVERIFDHLGSVTRSNRVTYKIIAGFGA